MRVNEIVRESRLDEALPVAAGAVGIPMILSAVALGLKALSVAEMYNILSENDFDLDNMDNDELLRLFIIFIMLFVPGAGKASNEIIMRLLPGPIRNMGIRMVRNKLAPMAQELRKMRKANRAGYTTNPAKAAKANAALTAQYRAVGRQLAAEKLKGVALTTIGLAALGPLTYTYYGKLDDLDKQYTAYKNGDKSTALFGSQEPNEAWDTYNDRRLKLIGELTVGVSSALASTPVAKLSQIFANLVGKIPGVGGILKLPLTITNKLTQLGGPAIAIAIQTDIGQKFLSNSLVEMIVSGVGFVSSKVVNALTAFADFALKQVGVDSNLQAKAQGQPKPDGYKITPNFDRLAIYANPSNPKIKFIRGVQVTGPDGYVLNTIPKILAGIKRDAELDGRPNPVDRLKFNPALTYPEA